MKKDSLLELKIWYDDKNKSVEDLSDKQFYELLNFLDFELKCQELENGIIIYFLNDLQDGNLANIEQDIFFCNYNREQNLNVYQQQRSSKCFLEIKEDIIHRLENYLYDYFERDWDD